MEYLKKNIIKKNKIEKIELYGKKTIKVNDIERSLVLQKISYINLKHNYLYNLNNEDDIDETYLCTFLNNNINIDHVLLILIKINNVNNTFLVNYNDLNDLKIYKLLLKLNNKLFYKDSIFSGIITTNNRYYTLYLDNIQVLNGNLQNKTKLSEKLLMIHNILKNDYTYDSFQNPFYITLRSFFPLNHIEYIKKNGKIYFYPDNHYNKIFIHNHIYKEEKEIPDIKKCIFNVIKDPNISDVYKLYMDNKFINILDVYSKENSKTLFDLFEKQGNNLELACTWNIKRNSWVYN